MPYRTNAELPDSVRNTLPGEAQSVFRNVVNSALAGGYSEERAFRQAWGALKNQGWHKTSEGKWVKKVEKFRKEFEISKLDEDQHLAFGWASVIEKDGEQIIDHEDDVIFVEDLEKAAYDFVLKVRLAGEVHREIGVGELVESMVFTKEKQQMLGVDLNKVGWWIGFKVTDEDVWKGIKDGKYKMFSIGGTGVRTDLED